MEYCSLDACWGTSGTPASFRVHPDKLLTGRVGLLVCFVVSFHDRLLTACPALFLVFKPVDETTSLGESEFGCRAREFAASLSYCSLEYVITDAWIHAIAPGPSGDRGEMAMSPPRCACLFSLHSNFGLDVVPQLRAVPKLCAKVLKSHAFQGKRRCFLVVGCLLTLSPCGSDAQPLWERHYELEYQSALLSRYSMLTVEDRPNGAGGATAARKGSWGRRAQ